MAFRGVLDGVTGDRAHGWAFNSEAPLEAVDVDLFVDEEHVATVNACALRPDLRELKMGDGRHGFSCELPAEIFDGRQHSVSLRQAGTGSELDQSPLRIVLGVAREAAVKRWPRFWQPDRASFVLETDRPATSLIAALREGGRLAIVASFLPRPGLLGYQRALARSLRAAGFKVMVVQNVTYPEKLAIEPEVDLFVARRNTGFDFSAWLAGLGLLKNATSKLEELVLVNDSVFGPLFDLRPMFAKMSALPVDAWGITDSWQFAYHLQSYFLVLRRKAIASAAFAHFRESYPHPKFKSTVIELGEIGLTQALLSAGLKVAAYCPYREVAAAWLDGLETRLQRLSARPELATFARTMPGGPSPDDYPGKELRNYQAVAVRLRRGLPVNPAHAFWYTLVADFKSPFIKRDLLFSNASGVPDICDAHSLIGRVSDYPLELIEEARSLGAVQLAQPIFPGAARR
jgi:hypothetical protein